MQKERGNDGRGLGGNNHFSTVIYECWELWLGRSLPDATLITVQDTYDELIQYRHGGSSLSS